jgi:O-antigen ligase
MGGNYLGVGRVLGIAIVILIPRLFMESKREFLVKFFFAFLLVGLLITLLILGGRGPFIATILCLLLAFLLVGGHVMTSTLRLVFAFLLLSAVASILSSLLPFTTLYRLQFLLEIPEWDVSAQGRLQRIQGAWEQITRAPIWGQGVGSFYYYHGDPALKRDYPHNIILELAAETGIIGLSLFFILVFNALRQIRWATISNHPAQLVAVLMLVHALLNAMVSGDLSDNRLLFVPLGLLTGFSTNSPAAEGVRR